MAHCFYGQDLHRHDAMSSDTKHAEKVAEATEGKWLAAEKTAQELEKTVSAPSIPTLIKHLAQVFAVQSISHLLKFMWQDMCDALDNESLPCQQTPLLVLSVINVNRLPFSVSVKEKSV